VALTPYTQATELTVSATKLTGNKVDCIGNKIECFGNEVERIRQQSILLPICCRFRQQSTFNKVDRVEFNVVAGVYRALDLH